jgi:hypothetical protein
VPAHYARREPGILDIFSEYSLKLPRICSNIVDISLSGRLVAGLGGQVGAQTTLATVWYAACRKRSCKGLEI